MGKKNSTLKFCSFSPATVNLKQLQVNTSLSAEWLHIDNLFLSWLLSLQCKPLGETTAEKASPKIQHIKSQITGKVYNSTVYKTLLHWHIWHKSKHFHKVKILIWILCIHPLHTWWSTLSTKIWLEFITLSHVKIRLKLK